MKEMAKLAAEGARLSAEAIPLMRNTGRNATRLHQLTEQVVHLEGRADELYDSGLKALFASHGKDRAMSFFVGRDLLQLILAPVRPLEVFIARAVLAMTANFLISAILLAAVLGVGAGSNAPPAFYPLAVLLVINQAPMVTAFQALQIGRTTG